MVAIENTFKTWIAVESKSVSDFTNYLKSSVQDHFGNMNRLSNRAEPAVPRPRLQGTLHRIGGSVFDLSVCNIVSHHVDQRGAMQQRAKLQNMDLLKPLFGTWFYILVRIVIKLKLI